MRTAWWHRVKTPSVGPKAGCPRYASDTMLEPLTGEGKTEGTCGGKKNRKLLMEIYQKQFPSVSDPKVTWACIRHVSWSGETADSEPLIKQNLLPI